MTAPPGRSTTWLGWASGGGRDNGGVTGSTVPRSSSSSNDGEGETGSKQSPAPPLPSWTVPVTASWCRSCQVSSVRMAVPRHPGTVNAGCCLTAGAGRHGITGPGRRRAGGGITDAGGAWPTERAGWGSSARRAHPRSTRAVASSTAASAVASPRGRSRGTGSLAKASRPGPHQQVVAVVGRHDHSPRPHAVSTVTIPDFAASSTVGRSRRPIWFLAAEACMVSPLDSNGFAWVEDSPTNEVASRAVEAACTTVPARPRPVCVPPACPPTQPIPAPTPSCWVCSTAPTASPAGWS